MKLINFASHVFHLVSHVSTLMIALLVLHSVSMFRLLNDAKTSAETPSSSLTSATTGLASSTMAALTNANKRLTTLASTPLTQSQVSRSSGLSAHTTYLPISHSSQSGNSPSRILLLLRT
jgi:hypothetical protein